MATQSNTTTATCVFFIGIVAVVFACDTAMAGERQKISPTIVPNFNQPDLSAANDRYQLTTLEQAYDCKKLTGHMQIRIRELRSSRNDTPPSLLARSMQKAVTPILAGTTRGIDPAGDNARDLGMLRAFNAQLGVKKCQTFDLDAQLAPGNMQPPHPIAKAKATAAPFVLKAAPVAPKAP